MVARQPRVVVGVDLAGAPWRNTGVCLLRGRTAVRASVLHSDPEILAAVTEARPALTLIDAPLSLPRGRRTIEDRSGPHFRECDRELRRRKIPFFPITLGPMRMLTSRGLRIASRLRREGLQVEEGYPGGAQDLLGLPRKSAGERRLQRALRARGLRGDLEDRRLSHDELDAVTLAWTARLFLEGRGQVLGDPDEGIMILPAPARATRRTEQIFI